MGKGDKKSRRGKIILGTYGVRRKKRSDKQIIVASKPVDKVKAEPKPEAVVKEVKAESGPEKPKAEVKKADGGAKAEPKPKAKKTAEPAKKAVEE
jgi:30S ribosomal protein S31